MSEMLARLLAHAPAPFVSLPSAAQIDAHTERLRALRSQVNVARMLLEDYEKLCDVAERTNTPLSPRVATFLSELEG